MITLNAAPFHATLKTAGISAAKFGDTLKKNVASAIGPTALVASAGIASKAIMDYADEMGELADRLRTGTAAAQEWNLAARLNGQGADFAAANFQKMEKALIAASEGDAKATRSLKALGIQMNEVKTITVDQAMRRIATTTEGAGDQSERAAAFLDIFGKSASKLRVVLDDLAKSEAFTKLGIFADDGAIRNVKAYADAWTVVGVALKSAGTKAASPGSILSTLAQLGPGGGLASLAKAFGLSEFLNKKIAGALPPIEEPERKGKDKAEAIAKAVEKAESIREKNRQAALSDEQRLNELAKEREAIFARIAKGAEQRAQKDLDLVQNEAEIIAIKKRLDKPDTVANRTRNIQSDSLSSIGNFLGQSTNTPQIKALSEQTKVLKDIERNTKSRGVGTMEIPA
jgi:hypothetical protein